MFWCFASCRTLIPLSQLPLLSNQSTHEHKRRNKSSWLLSLFSTCISVKIHCRGHQQKSQISAIDVDNSTTTTTTPLMIRLANLPPRQSFNSRPRHPLTCFQTSTTITRGTCNMFYHLPLFLRTLLDRRPPSMPHILVMIIWIKGEWCYDGVCFVMFGRQLSLLIHFTYITRNNTNTFWYLITSISPSTNLYHDLNTLHNHPTCS